MINRDELSEFCSRLNPCANCQEEISSCDHKSSYTHDGEVICTFCEKVLQKAFVCSECKLYRVDDPENWQGACFECRQEHYKDVGMSCYCAWCM